MPELQKTSIVIRRKLEKLQNVWHQLLAPVNLKNDMTIQLTGS